MGDDVPGPHRTRTTPRGRMIGCEDTVDLQIIIQLFCNLNGHEYLNMAKATIRTPQGLQVRIEGTPSEITALVKDLERQSGNQKPAPRRRKTKSGRVLLVDLIGSLRDGGFFKKPRDLASIKAALAEMGHHYPMTTLSPAMLRKVRSKEIRRIREQKHWLYVQ